MSDPSFGFWVSRMKRLNVNAERWRVWGVREPDRQEIPIHLRKETFLGVWTGPKPVIGSILVLAALPDGVEP
jgi:hypothetical protein